MLPKISIVTVSYNQSSFIEENIKSVINQNYSNVEHIIIDAGSTDGTLKILQRYDKYLDWISEADEGQSHGLNKGFKKAEGQIIGWINSDDKLAPGALHKIAAFFIENPNEIAVVGDQAIIDSNSSIKRIIKSRSYDFNYLLNHSTGITQNSTFFLKEVFDQINYLDENLHYAMDLDLFLRIARIRKIPYLPETLAEFRMHPNSKTAEGIHKFALESIRIRKKYGSKLLSPAWKNDVYLVLTQPLRRIKWMRQFVQKIRIK